MTYRMIIVLLLAALVAACTSGSSVRQAGGEAPSGDASGDTGDAAEVVDTCTVARIIDGDTLVCREGDERVRLLLIDAPERSQGEYGRRATEALEELLPPGTSAPVEFDVQRRDRYGRLLAYIYDSEGRMVNLELARRGFAVISVYPPNVLHVDRIRAAAEEAREQRRGLWSSTAFECAPADHRQGRC